MNEIQDDELMQKRAKDENYIDLAFWCFMSVVAITMFAWVLSLIV